MNNAPEIPDCVCGDEVGMHIDNEDQCVVVDCGCKEYEAPPTLEELADGNQKTV